ncbi:MAG TPA: hypothetical protein VFW73_02890 [Lacipirellulaceae bacterium]|nr:hypothetical protein [Lacipirellulaceae bacterium]
MAREESSRENFLHEATALVERIELAPHSFSSQTAGSDAIVRCIVAGFRTDGAFSIFFEDDPVYQFTAAGDLRRAYCNGMLLKAVRGRLVSLQRVRTPREVQLVRHELSAAEEADCVARMTALLHELTMAIDANHFEVIGQVPANGNVLSRLRRWLTVHKRFAIAARPNVGR